MVCAISINDNIQLCNVMSDNMRYIIFIFYSTGVLGTGAWLRCGGGGGGGILILSYYIT